jgi:hypothetical protein
MGSLLSAISGQFAKFIVLGTLFPVIVVTALNLMLVVPLLPSSAQIPIHIEKIAVGDEKWQAVFLSFLVLILTGLLYDLNIPVIRFYEGYPWRGSLLGRSLLYFQKKRRNTAKALRLRGDEVRRNSDANPDQLEVVTGLRSRLGQFLNSELPDSESLVLPTRLGNVIRAFERYPAQAYGIDAIALWPRLIGKLDPAFAATIDEAKTSFDFMLNMSFLSGLTTLFILAIGIIFPLPLRWTFVWPLLGKLLFFALLTVVFYYLSVNRAHDWGSQVKSAFDLYRFDLLKALGYLQRPFSYQEERVLWSTISSQILFPDDRKAPLPYEQSPTRLIPFPSNISVSVDRKFIPAEDAQQISVYLTLINRDSSRKVNSLRVIDTIPEGYSYVIGSAALSTSGIGIRVTSLSPISFFVGSIAEGGTLELHYLLKPSSPPQPHA